MDESLKPLSMLRQGESGTVMNLAGGTEFQSRVISMGIMVGCDVTVVKNGHKSGGPVLTAIGDSRIMIGHGMTDKIMIEVN